MTDHIIYLVQSLYADYQLLTATESYVTSSITVSSGVFITTIVQFSH